MKRLLPVLCLTLAVFLGSTGVSWSADFQKGLDAYDRGDYATALREWTPLAENKGILSYLYSKKDIISAQSGLGSLSATGRGVSQNHKTAVKWYTLAAKQGYAHAQHNLGVMYANGRGVPQNDKTAVKWYTL